MAFRSFKLNKENDMRILLKSLTGNAVYNEEYKAGRVGDLGRHDVIRYENKIYKFETVLNAWDSKTQAIVFTEATVLDL